MAKINETVLEMHFHSALINLFSTTFGLGRRGQLNFFKYSPRRECFVGFDQAYARTEMDTDQFFDWLRGNAVGNGYRLAPDDKFFGYFLQFKVVQQMRTRSRYTPAQIINVSHYRSKLDTTRNMNTGVSQHELLYNLKQNKGAMVYYACPMIFDHDELYAQPADLDALNLADLGDCQSPYTDNENHFIYFNDPGSNPVWCSKPHEGKLSFAKDLSALIHHKIERIKPPESREQIIDLLTDIRQLKIQGFRNPQIVDGLRREGLGVFDLAYESLTILKISQG